MRRAPRVVTLSLGLLCAAPRALAEPAPSSDGVYGRFDGDLTLSAGLGAELEAAGARAALRLSAFTFHTAGLTLLYAEGFGAGELERRVGLGVELRPSFLPRWSLDWQQGPALADLVLDSVGLGVAAWWGHGTSPGGKPPRGLELSLGAGVPLAGSVDGPWLEARGSLRWSDPGRGPSAPVPGALLVVGWTLSRVSPWAAAAAASGRSAAE